MGVYQYLVFRPQSSKKLNANSRDFESRSSSATVNQLRARPCCSTGPDGIAERSLFEFPQTTGACNRAELLSSRTDISKNSERSLVLLVHFVENVLDVPIFRLFVLADDIVAVFVGPYGEPLRRPAAVIVLFPGERRRILH